MSTRSNTAQLRGARLDALERSVDRLGAIVEQRRAVANRISWLRVLTFAVGLITCLATFFVFGSLPFWFTLVVAIGLFALVVSIHRRLETSLARFVVCRQIKLDHLARARLDWDRLPQAATFELRSHHPFEFDLDLVGDYSLHRLLDTAVAPAASLRLRDWLTALDPAAAQIAARQRLVQELAPLTLFRDRLALSALTTGGALRESGRLMAWLESGTEAAGRLRPRVMLLAGLALLNVILFAGAWLGLIPTFWPVSFVVYAAVYLLASRGIGAIFHEAMDMRDGLQQLTAVFDHLESFSYRGVPQLGALCAPFRTPGQTPSAHLRRVSRVAAATGIQGNPLIAVAVNAVAPWNLFFAYRLAVVKAEIRDHLPSWIELWTELEALSALANFAHLNPDYPFPELLDPSDAAGPILAAHGMGHPLISRAARVSNDFTFQRAGDIGLITGSNMAGKSTFLKTVGINLVLAHCGAPVAAAHLAVAPLRLFTSMRISDSLSEGFSYFYAEVQRLKTLLVELDAADPPPLLFLIDEIFRGTNNRERLIGSRAYVRSLAGKRGVGLIATHDLELAKLADEAPSITNYHFRDEIVAGRMTFDYRLHPGPCPTTNALKIMALEGLPVESLPAELELPGGSPR